MEPPRGFWAWLSEARVTYALKLLMVLVLAFYAGQFLLGALERISGVIYILIGSVFFAYLIHPLLAWLRRRMPRLPLAVAILLVYALIAAAIVAFGFLLLPRFVEDGASFVANYPAMVDRFHAFVSDPNDPIASHLPPFVLTTIARIPSEIAQWVRVNGFQTASHLIPVLAGTFAIVATFVVIPMVTAYLLLDMDNLKTGLEAVVPPQRWRWTLGLLADFDAVVGGFIRGQLLVACSVGLLITIAMLVLHVRYAFLIGLLAVIGDLIPYVGALIAFVPAIASSLTLNGPLNGLFVLIAFVAIFQAEGHLLAPNIVSKTVSLSPFAVLLALLIGGSLAGLVGVLIAVPVAGVLRVVALRVFPSRDAKQPQP